MHSTEVDVLVIGAGVAGIMAAASARERGCKTAVLYHSSGVSGLSSGSVDFADSTIGSLPRTGREIFDRGLSIREAMELMAREFPWHPYARIQEKGRSFYEPSVKLFKRLTATLNWFTRLDGCNTLVITDKGTIKHSALLQGTLALDLMDNAYRKGVGIVGLSGLTRFCPYAVVQMLEWLRTFSRYKDFQFTSFYVKFMKDTGGFFRDFFQVAEALDEEENQSLFIFQLKEALVTKNYLNVLLFPAILGRLTHRAFLQKIENETGLMCRELLATNESIPGLRLGDAIKEGAQKAGIEMIRGNVSEVINANKSCRQVLIEQDGQISMISAKKYILASGRFFRSNLPSSSVSVEAIKGLPIWNSLRPIEDNEIDEAVEKDKGRFSDILRGGVNCDEKLRPLDIEGTVFADNLFAAGSILEGYDPGRDKSALGVAILTGYLAGLYASEQASYWDS